VAELDRLVTKKAGFDRVFTVTGQTYPRVQDAAVLSALAILGAAVHQVYLQYSTYCIYVKCREKVESKPMEAIDSNGRVYELSNIT